MSKQTVILHPLGGQDYAFAPGPLANKHLLCVPHLIKSLSRPSDPRQHTAETEREPEQLHYTNKPAHLQRNLGPWHLPIKTTTNDSPAEVLCQFVPEMSSAQQQGLPLPLCDVVHVSAE